MKKITSLLALSLSLALLLASCTTDAAESPRTAPTGSPPDIRTAVVERFLEYISHDTTSDPGSDTSPSTSEQMDFAKLLYEECKAIGLSDVSISEYGVVMATLPANTDGDFPVLGFISHVDTSAEASGANITPQIVENYDGGDIALNETMTLSPDEFPAMMNYIGQTLITTSGDTLLGTDDKSGIAEILTAMEYLINSPEIPHGKIRIAFTPDEEIGRGTENFDVEAFGADFAFTVDGGPIGELEYENFNAANATIEITGRSIHPGRAKGIMVNSSLIAAEIAMALPPDETPATTEGYEGFYHMTGIDGDVSKTTMGVLVRSFDTDDFEARKSFVTGLVDALNEKYGLGTIALDMNDLYYNMVEMVDPKIIDFAMAAYAEAGVEADIVPIRGGTDGARLSFMGLPCPNIFTGGHNIHGPYEFIPVESMVKAVDVIVSLSRMATALD